MGWTSKLDHRQGLWAHASWTSVPAPCITWVNLCKLFSLLLHLPDTRLAITLTSALFETFYTLFCLFYFIFILNWVYWSDAGQQNYTAFRCTIPRHLYIVFCVFTTLNQVSFHHNLPPFILLRAPKDCYHSQFVNQLGQRESKCPGTGVTEPKGASSQPQAVWFRSPCCLLLSWPC